MSRMRCTRPAQGAPLAGLTAVQVQLQCRSAFAQMGDHNTATFISSVQKLVHARSGDPWQGRHALLAHAYCSAPPNAGCRIAPLRAARKSRSEKRPASVQRRSSEVASCAPRIHLSLDALGPGVPELPAGPAPITAPQSSEPSSRDRAHAPTAAALVRAQCSCRACCKCEACAAS